MCRNYRDVRDCWEVGVYRLHIISAGWCSPVRRREWLYCVLAPEGLELLDISVRRGLEDEVAKPAQDELESG